MKINNENRIAILMATYNGEKYLKEQLDSLFAQTYKNWHLIIRDDGSSDNTWSVLKKFKSKYPAFITLLKNKTKIHGAKNNFLFLANYILDKKYKYIMFCDQDDVWLPHKIERTLKRMKKIDQSSIPSMVYTDLCVVDAKLNVINKSFRKYSHISLHFNDLNHWLVEGVVAGCTMMMNNKLLEKAMDVTNYQNIVMHDWWFALVAMIFGKVSFINESTILYRQHSENVIGAENLNSIPFILKKAKDVKQIKKSIKNSFKQASFILETYDDIPKKSYEILTDFIKLQKANKLEKIKLVHKYKFLKQGKVKQIAEYLFL